MAPKHSTLNTQQCSCRNMIPVNTPLLEGNEKKYLQECIDTGWISSEGPFVKKFESAFSKLVDRSYGVAVANGTAALEIAVQALGVEAGDEVIMPTFTIISCAAAIVKAGAKPVLIDADPETWNMDVTQIEAKITQRTKAIMVVHIYGLPVDMDPVIEIAEKYGLKIIEDAAEAHGLMYKEKPCGSFGDISVFSFYPNKHVTTGEGGMIVCDDELLAEKCRSYRNLCFQAEKRFIHEELGWNARMTNMQAALGLAQLEQIDIFLEKKKNMGKYYQEQLSSIEQIRLPRAKTDYAENGYWVFGILLKQSSGVRAAEVMEKLKEKRIGSRPFFYPMHLQPVFKKRGLFKGEMYPVAEHLAEKGFYIPSGLALQDDEIAHVAEKVKKCLQ